jgi:hypothetical protein
MTCTGMTHGSTLSYTRLLGVPEIMRWRDINSKIWQKNDVALMTGGLGKSTPVTMTIIPSQIIHKLSFHFFF